MKPMDSFPVNEKHKFFFFKKWIHLKFSNLYIIFHDVLQYCDMPSEITQYVAYDIIMVIVNISTSYSHKISFHYFED